MFLQELSTPGEHQYNALKSRAYHPTPHLRARGCLAIAATGVKVQVLYQVIEPLNDLIYKILLSPAVSWPQQRLLRLQVLSALENSSHFPRRNNPTDQLIGYSRSYCSLEQRFSSSPAEELQSPHHSFPQSWLLLHKYKLHRITLSDDTSTSSVKTLTDQRNGSSSG
ncbi:unnamed protein product [Sphagnum jensenii]|jgi:hypothetical protein|uniref:Maturase K n=1 Tax=Sphagnum jensenii TaxID=128206 RepID=A0ABP0XIL6_9BRYO